MINNHHVTLEYAQEARCTHLPGHNGAPARRLDCPHIQQGRVRIEWRRRYVRKLDYYSGREF